MIKEILVYDEIGFWGLTAQTFRQQLQALQLAPQDELLVAVNSPGGEIYDGLAIHAQIRHANVAKRTVRIDGLAASMGSVIAMAGDEIEMGDGALMMIHDPSGWAAGTSGDMRELADVLDKHKSALVGIYERRTGKPADEIAALMAAETWFTAAEAVAAGFATRTGPSPQVQARLNPRALDRYQHAPAAARKYFTARAPRPQEIPPMDENQKRRRGLTLALLSCLPLLAAQDPTDPELQAAAKDVEPRCKALRSQGLPDLGSPLALLDSVEAVDGAALSFTDASARVLVLAAKADGAHSTEAAVKAALVDEAIKAGKPVAPAHRAAWLALPMAQLRDSLERLPVVQSLPQAAKRPSANPNAREDAEQQAQQGDDSYKAMRDGLGLKPQKAVA